MTMEQPRMTKKDREKKYSEKGLLPSNEPKLLYMSKNKKAYVCEYADGEIGIRNTLFSLCNMVPNGPATMIMAKKFCEEASLVPLREFAEE